MNARETYNAIQSGNGNGDGPRTVNSNTGNGPQRKASHRIRPIRPAFAPMAEWVSGVTTETRQ